jgi:hypothetical protein
MYLLLPYSRASSSRFPLHRPKSGDSSLRSWNVKEKKEGFLFDWADAEYAKISLINHGSALGFVPLLAGVFVGTAKAGRAVHAKAIKVMMLVMIMISIFSW